MSLTVGSLFAGIGGFDLGLERAGMHVLWQVEYEPWCQHILNKHWPDVPCYSDIRDVRGKEVASVDVLCGGFPCQDISNAGKRAGIEGARSSLWKEYARLVDEIRPRYVIVENVAALRKRGLDVVLGDLSTLGYDAEWDCLRASDFGAPHRRDRLWLVACAQREQGWGGKEDGEGPAVFGCDGIWAVADSDGARRPTTWRDAISVAAADREGQEREPARGGLLGPGWPAEPDVGRVAHGVPARLDRLRGLGNALVPQIAEWIGHRVVARECALRPGVESDQARLTA